MVIRNMPSAVKLDCPYVLILEQSSEPALAIQSIDEGAVKSDKYIFTAKIATFIRGEKNNNGREYIKSDYLRHIPYLKEKARKGILLGELDHPEYFDMKGSKASHKILDVWYDEADDTVKIKFEILDTFYGTEARKLVDAGVPIAVSTRSAGKVDANGVVTLFKIFTVDIVIEPGFSAAVAQRLMESNEEHLNFDVYKVHECLDKIKKDTILNKLELVESASDQFTKIYKINESAYFPFFNQNYAEFDIANKINEEEEMSKINELEAQIASLTKMMTKVLENVGQAQDDKDKEAQIQVQVQDAQPAQPSQPAQEVQGGETLGVGGAQPAQGLQGAQPNIQDLPAAQPTTPISVQPAAQPTVPPIPTAPAGGFDVAQIVPQLFQIINTLADAVGSLQNKVGAQGAMLNTIEESFNVENSKIVNAFSQTQIALDTLTKTINEHAMWTESIREATAYNSKLAERIAMYQDAVTTKTNEGLLATKLLESKLAITEGYIRGEIDAKINETAGVVNQITNMIDEGNMLVGKTSIGGKSVKEMIASIKESNEAIIAGSKADADYQKLVTTFPFLQFMTEADRSLFLGESLNTEQKTAIHNYFKTYGYTNAKDTHEVMIAALESVNVNKEGVGIWYTLAPAEYKELFDKELNESEKASIIKFAATQQILSKPAVDQFWSSLKLNDKLKLTESKKALLNTVQNASHSVEDFKKMVDAQKYGSDYEFEMYLQSLRNTRR